MWSKRPNVCRAESIRMCQSLFETEPAKSRQYINFPTKSTQMTPALLDNNQRQTTF